MQICVDHQEKVQFVSRHLDTNELIGLCSNCLPLPKGIPFQKIKNVQMNIEKNKTLMIKHLEDQKNHNVKTMNQLIEYLNNYKNTQAEKINHMTCQLKKDIDQMEKNQVDHKIQIEEYTASIDIEKLVTLFHKLESNSCINQKIEKLQEQLIQIQQHQFLFDAFSILNEIPQNSILDLYKTEDENYLEKIYRCQKHHDIVVKVDFNSTQSSKNDLFCIECVDQKKSNKPLIKLEEVEQIRKKYILNLNDCCMEIKSLIKTIFSYYFDKFDDINKKLGKFLLVFQKYINFKQNSMKELIQNQGSIFLDYSSTLHLENLKKMSKITTIDWEIYKSAIIKLDNNLKLKLNSPNFYLIRLKQFMSLFTNFRINQLEFEKKVQYEEIQVIKQQDWSKAIAINSKGNILVAGCGKKINVFEFDNGIKNLLQQLEGHQDDIFCLQFMRNSNSFISSSKDKTIRIWVKQEFSWISNQTLEGHTEGIQCIFINNKGNMLVSGSSDKSIKFWNLMNGCWAISQTMLEHQQGVLGLSLNEAEDKLISCGHDAFILIMQKNYKQEWYIIQQIGTQPGLRICFLANGLFSYQPKQQQLLIFKFSEESDEFQQIKEIKMKGVENSSSIFFPQQFNKLKQILFNKYEKNLNIIRIFQDGQLRVDQTIEFQVQQHYGTISEDGEFLITWDSLSKEISVKQQKDYIILQQSD